YGDRPGPATRIALDKRVGVVFRSPRRSALPNSNEGGRSWSGFQFAKPSARYHAGATGRIEQPPTAHLLAAGRGIERTTPLVSVTSRVAHGCVESGVNPRAPSERCQERIE